MPNYPFSHLHLFSPDPVKTAQFYQKMFGAQGYRVWDVPGGPYNPFVALDLGGLALRWKTGTIDPPLDETARYGIGHIGLEVDNVEKTVAELKATGEKIRFVREIGEKITEEIGSPYPGMKSTFVIGPENVIIQLTEHSQPR